MTCDYIRLFYVLSEPISYFLLSDPHSQGILFVYSIFVMNVRFSFLFYFVRNYIIYITVTTSLLHSYNKVCTEIT